MSIDRSRRTAFEEVAELYDDARPRYPEALIDELLAVTRLPAGGRILEVGCGPGNLTVALAQRGYPMLCLELGPRLAALARKNCAAWTQVEIRNTTFEAWELEASGFDLVVSAEAFHWVPPEIGYPKAAAALRAGGSLALVWILDLDPATGLARAINRVYREQGLENPERSLSQAWLEGQITGNIAAAGCFGPVTVRQVDWRERYTTERYLKLLQTRSFDRALEPARREALWRHIGQVVEAHGGQFELPQRAVLFQAGVAR